LIEEARFAPIQAALEPYGTGRRFFGKVNLNEAISQASALLSKPSAENFAKLRELASLYPEVRTQIIRSGYGGMLAGQEQTREMQK
jgi:hypothetical protein